MNGCTNAYNSRKQTIAYEDTCSTNFIAAAEGSVMIIWTHNLCEELDLRRSHPTVLFQDNQYTIKVIEATKFNYKTKSAELKFHKTRDLYESGDFDIRHSSTIDMLVDIFTKPLGLTQFCNIRERLNVVPLPQFEISYKQPTMQ